MEPATTAALIGAGSNILSGIGSGLLQDSPERNVRRWSGTQSYPFPFMEGFSEMHPFPGITGPPSSSGWQPPQVEQRPSIQHDGMIPISWVKQAYATNRPDKLQDLPRWLRDHGIAENAEYVTPEQFDQMTREGFSGMSGVSQGAVASIGADIQSRQRVGRAANQFYAGARGEGVQEGAAPQQAGLPFAMPDQQGGGSFETVAQTASSLFGKGQGTTPGQLGALPGQSVSVPSAPQEAAVPPMPAQQQAPPMPQRQPATAPQQQEAMPPPPPPQRPQVQAQAPPPPSFPGTDPLAMAPQVAQAVQEQIQTDPLQPATENTYVQQLLAALQQDLNTPFVG